MTPAAASYRFLCAFLLGAVLGVYYGFLRPLRPKRTLLADLLFSLGCLLLWLRHSFALCRGDIRVGYFFAFFAGGVSWELTAGRCLRPLFSAFWKWTRRPMICGIPNT